MAEPLRHRQTKGAATDMFYLTPPRHISTLPIASFWLLADHFRSTLINGHSQSPSACLKGATTGLLLVHSITLSALTRSPGGTESPSCLAVLRLMDNSNLVTW